MALADLDALIYDAKANQANLYSIFFDMEHAFPGVWAHHICAVLHKYRMRGPLPLLIQNYFRNRSFKVRIGGTHSTEHQQENGIPKELF